METLFFNQKDLETFQHLTENPILVSSIPEGLSESEHIHQVIKSRNSNPLEILSKSLKRASEAFKALTSLGRRATLERIEGGYRVVSQ